MFVSENRNPQSVTTRDPTWTIPPENGEPNLNQTLTISPERGNQTLIKPNNISEVTELDFTEEI